MKNTLDDGVIFRNEGLAANVLGLCQIQGEDWDNVPLVALLLDWITATLRARLCSSSPSYIFSRPLKGMLRVGL